MTSNLSSLWWCSSVLTLCVVYARACEHGWFGSLCQYKCHCTNNSCTTSGDCGWCTKCEIGWFGTACQYEDLIQYGRVTAHREDQDDLLTDNNDATCVTISTSLGVVWNVSYPFTWMRLTVKEAVKPESLTVEFHDSDNVTVLCHDRSDIKRSETAFDIACNVSVSVQQINIVMDGDTTMDICSIYVSGGRNVALKQKVNQSTVLINKTHHLPELAVDGRKDDLWKRNQCSHTDEEGDMAPRWEVKLADPVRVSRYVIYNRHIKLTEKPVRPSLRLQKFRLTGYSEVNSLVFEYTDNSSQPQYVYVVTSWAKMAVSRVEIMAARNDKLVLALCEVEIFGETSATLQIPGVNQVHNITCDKPHEARIDYLKDATTRFPVTYVAIGASVAGILVLLVVAVAAMARRMSMSSPPKESIYELHHSRWDNGRQYAPPYEMKFPEYEFQQEDAFIQPSHGFISVECLQPGYNQPSHGFLPLGCDVNPPDCDVIPPGCGVIEPTYNNIMGYSRTWGSLEDVSSDS